MTWHGIVGHDDVVERFRRALDRGRLASTFLFVGPGGIGKRKFALKLAQALLCERRPAELLDPCEHCPACAQVLAGTHPDLDVVSKPADKSFIPVARLIGDKEHRMHEGLCHKIGLKPFAGGRKVAIIDDADDLNLEGANALLKTLEEPPPRSVLILIGTSADRQLPTIRSRSQMIRFHPLDNETVARLLLENKIATDPQEATRLAMHSGGSVARASELADPALWSFRGELLAALASLPADSVAAAKNVIEFVDSAGKDAGPRRRAADCWPALPSTSFAFCCGGSTACRTPTTPNWPRWSSERSITAGPKTPPPRRWTVAWKRSVRSIATPTRRR